MRLGIFCLVTALCLIGEAAAYEFTTPTTIQQRNIRDFAPCGDRTLVLTDHELVLVDWSRPDGERDSVLVAGFHDGQGLHRSGAAQVALAPVGQGGHAVVVPHDDGTWSVDFVDDPEWLPPQVWLGGRPWFMDERDRDGYLLPALGRGGEGIHVASPDILNPDMFAMDGDRAVAGLVTDEDEGEVGRYQVGDLSDPENPVWGPIFEVAFRVTAVEMVGRTLCLGTNRFECWDVTDVQAPVFRGVTGGSRWFDVLEHAGDGLVGCWSRSDNRHLCVVDVNAPDDPRVIADDDVWWDYYRQPYCLTTDHIVFREGRGLRRMYSPQGTLVIHPAQNAWPVIDTDLPPILASDGRHAWIQAEGRILVDLATGGLANVPTPTYPANDWGETRDRQMFYHRGHLLHSPGNGYLHVEDISDPAHAVVVAEVRPPTDDIRYMDLEGDRLLLRFRTHADVYDVSAPASPELLYSHSLQPPGDRAELLPGCLAILIDHEDMSDSLSVLVPDGMGSYVEVGHYTLWDRTYYRTYSVGHILYLLGFRDDPFGGGWYWSGIGLDAPSEPQGVNPGDPPLSGGVSAYMEQDSQFLVLVAASEYPHTTHTWELSRTDGMFDPDRPILDSLKLSGAAIRATTAGDRVVVLHSGAVSTFRVNAGPSGTPPPVAAPAVRAVPNPFNPMTEIVFTMPVAGTAELEVFDVRGRRVFARGDRWPEGEVRVLWVGRSTEGHRVAAGVYLLRVTTPGGISVGRCVMVR